jgi:hypothetical protein
MPNTRRKKIFRFLALLFWIFFVAACSVNAINLSGPGQDPIDEHERTLEVLQPAQVPVQLPEIPDSVFYVHPGIDLGEINPFVYGVNHGPWAVITDQTLPLAREAGINLIRFPGGEWGDNNDLQPYHIDQFVALAEQMGSEVSINVRLLNGTPEKAAELVRYANLEMGYGIKHWGIGNEPSLYASGRGDPAYGVDQFNVDWRTIALAMKDVDDTILVSGPAIHQFGSDFDSTPKDPFGKDWMREFLIANGDLVDVVSFHRYPFPSGSGGRAATIEALSAASQEWDAIIPFLRGMINEITGRDIPIAVTEINSHWSNAVGGEATPDSFYNAIWWADVLGRMIFNRVAIVNYFSLQSQVSIGGYGLFARSEPRPTYYIYRLYKEFGENLVFAGCNDPQVGVYAAKDTDGGLSVIIVNLGEEFITQPLVIEGAKRNLVDVWRFDEDHLLYQPDLNEFGVQDTYTILGQSIILLKFE